jgi:DNA-binding MarR family transcriptional regulator
MGVNPRLPMHSVAGRKIARRLINRGRRVCFLFLPTFDRPAATPTIAAAQMLHGQGRRSTGNERISAPHIAALAPPGTLGPCGFPHGAIKGCYSVARAIHAGKRVDLVCTVVKHVLWFVSSALKLTQTAGAEGYHSLPYCCRRLRRQIDEGLQISGRTRYAQAEPQSEMPPPCQPHCLLYRKWAFATDRCAKFLNLISPLGVHNIGGVHFMNIVLDVHLVNTLWLLSMERGVATSIRPGEDERVVLGLLEFVEQDGATSQRRLAAELWIAVGLVNAYLNRCIQKGLVNVSRAPARRYAYYLTPQGFVEKFFRQAKLECQNASELARVRGFTRIALDGVSDIAEIATICVREDGIEIVAIVDEQSTLERFAGIPIACNCDTVLDRVHAVIITDVRATQARVASARKRLGHDRVLIPSLLQKASGLDGIQHDD